MTQHLIFNVLEGNGGNVGQIILNRPEALNAFSLDMIDQFSNQVSRWEQDTSIKAIIVRSNSPRAFCAGGDIKAIYHSQQKKDPDPERFFRSEYDLNIKIATLKKPYISFLDGITMGGGAGISIHGKFPVATENFTFAMPETAIGFFPDVGSAYFLLPCPNYTGWYLGLTGNNISTKDAYGLNIVSHVINASNIEACQEKIISTYFSATDKNIVESILSEFQTLKNREITLDVDLIEYAFKANSIEEILEKLLIKNTDTAIAIRDTLLKRSPTSLKVTFEHFCRSKNKSLSEILATEKKMAHHFLNGHDLTEGVRATIIDKDKNPKWNPENLEKVSLDAVNHYFS